MTALLFLTALLAPQEEFEFKRTFKANETSTYAIEMSFGKTKMTGQIVSLVKSVQADHAVVNYKASNIDMGLPHRGPLPDLTTKVGPLNMPNSADVSGTDEFLFYLAAAGITSGTKTKVGEEVKVSWSNDKKDTTVEGVGNVLDSNGASKSTTVQWTLTMKNPKAPPSTWKLKSVYSSANFDLISSEGTIEGLPVPLILKVTRKSF